MSKSIYEQLFDKLDIGIRVNNQERKPLIYNEKMRTIESMTLSDLTDRPFMDVFRFQHEKESRLIQALKYEHRVENKKQTYFNAKGEVITTINHVYPLVENGEVVAAVEIAKDVSQMEKILRDKRTNDEGTRFQFHDLLGESRSFLDVVEKAKHSSRTSSPVLIIGETGTGKELFAQSIHQQSDRNRKPFVTQNCAALPESLVEGILFGTAKGAFTGAVDRPGLFEQANAGTLLLDEVNALPYHLQPKLLRVLQENKVTRIGEVKERPIDVRLMATLNEDPFNAIGEERLRRDLYYRLSVVSLVIPPLRERGNDVEKLARFFLRKYTNRFRLNVERFTDEVFELLEDYDWPGNVRELEHAIEGAMNFLTDETVFDAQHLPPHLHRHQWQTAVRDDEHTLPEQVALFEERLITRAMDTYNGNASRAAKSLGISRQRLEYKVKRLSKGRNK